MRNPQNGSPLSPTREHTREPERGKSIKCKSFMSFKIRRDTKEATDSDFAPHDGGLTRVVSADLNYADSNFAKEKKIFFKLEKIINIKNGN